MTTFDADPERVVDRIFDAVGTEVVLAMPIAIGKANSIVNALYRRAVDDASIHLTILTALTLNKPRSEGFLQRRLLEPLVERVFGDYPDLQYGIDRDAGRLPQNVSVIEFFFSPGSQLGNRYAQQHYISSNYTHVCRDLFDLGVNVIAQEVAPSEDGETFSLSCNPDVTLDLGDMLRRSDRRTFFAAQTNRNLPYMYGDAVVQAEWFDGVLDNQALDHTLFGPPKTPVPDADYMIGYYASTLVRDDGDLQIGIGSLGDALVYALLLRQRDNTAYRAFLDELGFDDGFGAIVERKGDLALFEKGLHAGTEILVDGFMHLVSAGIVKREVYDQVVIQRLLDQDVIGSMVDAETLSQLARHGAIQSRLRQQDVDMLKRFGILRKEVGFDGDVLTVGAGVEIPADLDDPQARREIEAHCLGTRLENGSIVSAGFFLGPQAFYEWLGALADEDRRKIHMNRISRINQLYGHEELDRLHRKNARFVNTCLLMTLSGAAASDGLDDGSVVSGVGGQYNFVAMAQELEGGHSVLQLRSTRTAGGRLHSNIVFNYAHTTIPQHLRDIVVTEYGIADIRGKTDTDVAAALIEIADSRFQPALIKQAKSAGKLRYDYELPARYAANTPDKIHEALARHRQRGLFPDYPFGTDLTVQEQHLTRVLRGLQRSTASLRGKFGLARDLCRSLWGSPLDTAPADEPQLELLRRMQLDSPKGVREKFYARLLLTALRAGQ